MVKKRKILIPAIMILAALTGCGHEHSWTDATCTGPKTCTECGETEGEALGHTWVEATCTEPKICSVCGVTEGDALDHEWTEATCTESKTCNRCGETDGEPIDHEWTEATCTKPKTCSLCGETDGEALGHKSSDVTCTEDGTCDRCGEVVEALGHNWFEATCTKAKHCTRCGLIEGDALGHSFNDNVCENCGLVIVELQPELVPDAAADTLTICFTTHLPEGLTIHVAIFNTETKENLLSITDGVAEIESDGRAEVIMPVESYFSTKSLSDFSNGTYTLRCDMYSSYGLEQSVKNTINDSEKYDFDDWSFYELINDNNVDCSFWRKDFTFTYEDGVFSEPYANEIAHESTDDEESDEADYTPTMAELSAQGSATNYLHVLPFSYSGLIEQLEFEGYSEADATYGVDHCGANWNEQAVKKAEDYLDIMSFSRSGLISQLEFDGFTSDQAEYAADQVGY